MQTMFYRWGCIGVGAGLLVLTPVVNAQPNQPDGSDESTGSDDQAAPDEGVPPPVTSSPAETRKVPAPPYPGVVPGAGHRAPQAPTPGSRQVVTWPGFQELPGGGTRFFLQTTRSATAETEQQGNRTIVFVRNAGIHLSNNRRWLDTRFFNSPVQRARLERRRRDVALVLEMRASEQPTVSTISDDNGYHYLLVEFAPGQYSPDAAEAREPAAPTEPATAEPASRAADATSPPSARRAQKTELRASGRLRGQSRRTNRSVQASAGTGFSLSTGMDDERPPGFGRAGGN